MKTLAVLTLFLLIATPSYASQESDSHDSIMHGLRYGRNRYYIQHGLSEEYERAKLEDSIQDISERLDELES